MVGAGGELVSGRWASFLEARYHLGLAKLSKGIKFEYAESFPTLRTRALTLLVGIRYKLGFKASLSGRAEPADLSIFWFVNLRNSKY